jgi:hypothetical protein
MSSEGHAPISARSESSNMNALGKAGQLPSDRGRCALIFLPFWVQQTPTCSSRDARTNTIVSAQHPRMIVCFIMDCDPLTSSVLHSTGRVHARAVSVRSLSLGCIELSIFISGEAKLEFDEGSYQGTRRHRRHREIASRERWESRSTYPSTKSQIYFPSCQLLRSGA